MPPRKKTITASLEQMTEKTVADRNSVSELETLRTQISKEINTIIDSLVLQLKTFEEAKKKSEEEYAIREKQKKQTEEEQTFVFEMEKRKKEADFNEKLNKERKDFETQKENEMLQIKMKKESLEQIEKDYQNLKTQVTSFPTQLEKTIADTKKQIMTEMQKEYEADKKFLVQKYEYDIKLLQQQINNLQQLVKQQEKEIQILKDEKISLMNQVQNLAVAVIKGKDIPLNNTPNVD